MICTRDVSDVEYPKSCPDCGHHGLAHPFPGNDVEACVVCQMVGVRNELIKFAEDAANQMRELVERARVLIEDEEAGRG